MPPAWVIEEINQHGTFYMEVPYPPTDDSSNPPKQDEKKTHCETESEGSLIDQMTGIVPAGGNNSNSKVKFDLQGSTQETLGREDYTEEEFNNTFYRPCDFADIASWNRVTVKMFRQNMKQSSGTEEEDLQDLGDQCIRGLEHRLKGLNSKRNEIKTNAIYSVLGEQARRRRERLPADQQKLADIYSEHTYGCISDATNRGHRDYLATKEQPEKKYTGENNDDCNEEHNGKIASTKTLYSFDDFDVRNLRDELSFGSDESPVGAHARAMSQPQDVDENSFSAKAKREKSGYLSFSRFFKKKKSKSKKHKESSTTSTASNKKKETTTVSPRRKYRRSSM